MISTACYPYPVNETSTTRRAAMRPHIYSPSESHSSPRHIMYPHPHVSGSPSPNYIYSGYEHYYSKNSWASAAPGSWSTYYPHPLSSSLPEATVNPKVTILPPQPVLVSDIDTPSSLSSHSVLTPSSPFAKHIVGEHALQSMEFDEFDCDDDEDYIDSDFGDEMEGIEDTDLEDALVYGAAAPHVIKSTSALEGALGDTPSSPSNHSGSPADRKLSASVPGYPSASHRTASHHRQSSSPAQAYPQHAYTHRTSASLYHTSSLAGAFAPHPRTLPIHQPQPIRPIPPIPIADLTSSADDGVLPLLCQPVSDVVRYQLKEPHCGGQIYDQDNAMCDPTGLTQQETYPPTDGTCSVGKRFIPGAWTCG